MMHSQILIAAGNYDITHAIREALDGSSVTIKTSLTHRDTFYMLLPPNRYNLLIIDAAMYERQSGEFTLDALVRARNRLPRVAVSLDESSLERANLLGTVTLTSLDKTAITEVINAALGKVDDTRRFRGSGAGRTEEMYTLFDVTRFMAEVLDPGEVLNRVVEAARRLTGADEALILLPDERDPSQLVIRTHVRTSVDGGEQGLSQNVRLSVDDGVPGEVFKSGQPTLVKSDSPIRIKTRYFAHALLFVPIMLKNTTIGVLGVNNLIKKDAFDIHQQQLLTSLAAYAAIAIQNARSYNDSLERAHELELLVNASKTISTSLAMDETLSNICEQLTQVLNVTRTEVYQWSQTNGSFLRRAHCYRAVWQSPAGRHLDDETREDLNSALGKDCLWTQREGFESLWVPVAAGDQLLGALRVCYTVAPQNRPEQYMIYHAHTIAEEILNELAATPTSDVLRLMNNINKTLEADWCELISPDENGEMMTRAEVGRAQWIEPPYPPRALSGSASLYLAMEGETIARIDDDCSTLVVPLAHRGLTWGVIVFSDSTTRRQFSAREVDMARALAGQSATALENAQLVLELEDSLRSLSDAQDRLVQSARLSAMGELAAVVAHQINNPLTTIIIDTEMMLLNEPMDSDKYKPLAAVVRAGRRASGVARRLLSIARPSDAHSSPELIDVMDTVHGILSLVGTHIERRSIAIRTRFPPENQSLPPVLAIKGQLDDIWLNLLMNAHDAMQNQPNAEITIDVSYRKEEGQIVVQVADNGPGIPPRLQKQIFDPFFTTKPVGEGTGLGLHICKQVVEKINGTITLETEEGKGACFTVVLPAVANTNYGGNL